MVRHDALARAGQRWYMAVPFSTDRRGPDDASARGGRCKAADTHHALRLNRSPAAARAVLRRFIARWPYEPEDLRADTAPLLVGVMLRGDRASTLGHVQRLETLCFDDWFWG